MRLNLDPSRPVPLFQQIAEALRYRIAVGALSEGERLPGVREAATLWQVHFHTVRHAYQLLAEEGLVVLGVGRPTLVAPREERPEDALGAFLAGVMREASSRFGLSAADLAGRLSSLDAVPGGAGTVSVVECSLGQALAHAREIQDRWGLDARPWTLDLAGEPPPGPIVATFFHLQEVRRRWPHRLADLHFVAIHPDSALLETVRKRLGRNPARILLCDREASMAANVAMDLRTIFEPSGIPVVPQVLEDALPGLLDLAEDEARLFSPRVWGHLAPEVRAFPRAFEAAYRIRQADLDGLGPLLGLSPGDGAPSAGA